MSRREDIDNAIWSDEDFLELSADAKLVYLWSFTNPACGMAGIYRASPRMARVQTGLSPSRLDKAQRELADARFLFWEDGVIWVRTRTRHIRSKTVQIAKSIVRDLDSVPEHHPLRLSFLREYAQDPWLTEFLSGMGKAVRLTRTSPEPQRNVT